MLDFFLDKFMFVGRFLRFILEFGVEMFDLVGLGGVVNAFFRLFLRSFFFFYKFFINWGFCRIITIFFGFFVFWGFCFKVIYWRFIVWFEK